MILSSGRFDNILRTSCLAFVLLLAQTWSKVNWQITVKIDWLKSNLLHDLFFILSIKWRVSAKHNVKNYSTRPYVTLLIVFSLNYFRCEVIWRSNQSFHFLARIKLSSCPEVNNFECFAFYVIQHILRFDVSVHYIFFVHVKNGWQDLLHDLRCLFLWKYFIFFYSMKKVTSLTKLHDKYKLFFPLKNFKQFDDVWMIKFHGQSYLSKKLLFALFFLENGCCLDNLCCP